VRTTFALLFGLSLVAGTTQAPHEEAVRRINPPGLAPTRGYSHVVSVARARTLHIAGQVPLDRTGTTVGAGDFRAQTQRVFENLKTAVEAGGGRLDDIVKITTYLVDMSQLPTFLEVRAEYLAAQPPASTVVEVRRLSRPEFLVEVEAIAAVPE